MKKYTLFLARKTLIIKRIRNPILISKWNETRIKISQGFFFFYLDKMILSSLEEQISQNSREYSEKEEHGKQTSPTRCSKVHGYG